MRWQPVFPTLMAHLLAHAEHRTATDHHGQLLRYRHGECITYRRYDHLVQVLILLFMGVMAGAASFVHIHDVTVAHGQPSWIGCPTPWSSS
jgi:hypothetical protein